MTTPPTDPFRAATANVSNTTNVRTCTTTAEIPAGWTVICWAGANTASAGGFNTGHTNAVTDNLGNSYPPDASWTAATPGAWAWRRENIPAAIPVGTVFTFTMGSAALASAANAVVQVYAVPGTVADVSASVTGATTAAPGTSATGVAGGVAVMFLTIGAAGGAPSWDSPAAALGGAVTAGPITQAAWQPTSAAGTVTMGATVSSSQAARYKVYAFAPLAVGPPPSERRAWVRTPEGGWLAAFSAEGGGVPGPMGPPGPPGPPGWPAGIEPDVTPGASGAAAQTAAMQAAVNAAAAERRPLILPPGIVVTGVLTYAGTAPLLTVRGQGREASVLELAAGANGYLFTFNPATGIYPVVHFEGFTIDATATAQTGGGCINAVAAVQSRFDLIHFRQARDVSLWLDGGAAGQTGHHNWVTRCLFDNNRQVNGADQQCLRMRASDENYIAFNDFENWGGATAQPGSEPYAVKDWSGLQLIFGNTFVGGMEAVRIQDGTLTKVIGNMFDGVGMAGVHASGSQNLIAMNTFMDGSSYSNGRDAQINLDGGARATQISNNLFWISTSGQVRNAVNEISWGGIDTSLIIGNTTRFASGASLFGGNPVFEINGPNTVARLNPGQPDYPPAPGPVAFGAQAPPSPVTGQLWFPPP